MLAYLEANLHPEKITLARRSSGAATLSAALVQSHRLRAQGPQWLRIALAWWYDPDTGNYFHSGGTDGYSSYACFNPEGDYAVVVLLNVSSEGPANFGSRVGERVSGSFAAVLGQHVGERLEGKPAISLGN